MAIFRTNIHSEALGMQTQLVVYLPHDEPGKRALGKPSSLILLHGLMGNAESWTRRTNLEKIAETYHVAIFMPEAARSFYHNVNPGLNYFTYIAKELPQYITNTFQVKSGRENMMIAGLSMGGYGAIRSMLLESSTFSKVGAFSGMYHMENYLNRYKSDTTQETIRRARSDLQAIFGKNFESVECGNLHRIFSDYENKSNLPKLYLSCGIEDMLLPESREFHQILLQHDFPHIYEELEGNHEWNFWANSLSRMLKHFLG